MLGRYLLARAIGTVLMAIAVTLPAFLLVHFVPSDPVQAQLGDLASADPELVQAFRDRWGLDRPVWEQYGIFLNGLAHGNLGESIASRRPVLDDIRDYAPATFELATAAALLTVLFGLPLGVLAAIKRDSWIDYLARFVSLIGLSTPTFWLAFIALALFYGGLKIAPGPGQLDPGAIPPPRVTGLMTVDSLLAGDAETFRSALAHLILPATVLAASTIGIVTRTTRASMLEALSQDYIRVAHAKGLRGRAVILRHGLRNALIPVLTLGGLAYAQLLSGTVMTETIFSWPGLGRYAFESAVALDFPAILGITLVVAFVYLLINFLVDMSYAIIDPRVVQR